MTSSADQHLIDQQNAEISRLREELEKATADTKKAFEAGWYSNLEVLGEEPEEGSRLEHFCDLAFETWSRDPDGYIVRRKASYFG